ncbi:hypothetical protein [Nonomuraea endophytica]|uniref:Tetratricopeptide (TPR) repeat protein n=1 Tax=Nonomuraea endophytica TaxID=714136 RepID=A0A7W8A3C8_9ACTN|nr:hypothetical protein [Nonomuraea endophytica]MBB5077613.1 tetratricopeptide (TPR) repeat protein [Nonomuraea endophytica]
MIDIDDLIDEASDLPYGEARTLLLEQALRHAESGGDREQILAVRMELTEAYQFGSEPAKSFATFSRCVADFDADPELFDDWQTHTLLWQYKWIVDSMRDFPQVPLGRAHDALAEMERRYREAGAGLHAVHAQRCMVAGHVGDRAAAEEHFHHWTITPRDEMSDCEGCDPDGKIMHLAALGRDEEAAALAAPVVAGHLTCENQPQSILSCLLLPYVRTGRHAEAAQAHLKAYRLIQALPHYTSNLDLHLEFLARTGNENRGLEILQRELPRLEERASPHTLMSFLAAAGLLLRRLEELGHGDLAVAVGAAETSVAALRADVTGRARELAVAFDTRNGTLEQSSRIEACLTAQPLVDYLPLVPHARRVTLSGTAPQAGQTAAPEALSTADTLPSVERLSPSSAEASPADPVVAELGRLAQEHAEAGRRQEALDLLAGTRDGSLLFLRARLEEPVVAAHTLRAARVALRAQGDLALLATAALTHGELLRHLATNPQDVQDVAPDTTPDELAEEPGSLEELLAAYGEAAAVSRNPEQRAVAHAVRGEVLVAVDRPEEAAEDLIEAVALFTALGSTANAALARVDLAAAYLSTERVVEAAIAAEEALGLLEPGDYDNRVNAQWTRAHARRLLDEREAALADFTELAGQYTEPIRAARAWEAAGMLLGELDRDEESAGAFSQAVQNYVDAGARDEAGTAMRKQLSALYWADQAKAALDAVAPVREFLRTLDGEQAAFELAALDYDEARMLLSLDRHEEAAIRARAAVAAFTALDLEDLAEAAADLLEHLEQPDQD